MKIISSFFLALLLFSCDNQAPKEYFSKPKKSNYINITNLKTKKADNKKVLKTNVINNQNVKEKLFEFGNINNENTVVITTKFGDIKIKLYENTPLHRSNFILLSKRNFFDSTIFYRVIKNFIIQGGNSDKNNRLQKMAKIGMYRIPPEINTLNIHKRGAIAMAVQEQYYKDPSKYNLSSSPFSFYIVQKGPLSDNYMNEIEKKYKIKIPEKNRATYRKVGGSPHLDNEYTVFGEVISGMSIVDKISDQITDGKNRPIENIYITIKALKL